MKRTGFSPRGGASARWTRRPQSGRAIRVLMALLATLSIATMTPAQAAALAVEVNTAPRASLEQLKGIGVAAAERILDVRARGRFADWADFEARIKGMGPQRARQLSEAGLTVNGQSYPGSVPGSVPGPVPGPVPDPVPARPSGPSG